MSQIYRKFLNAEFSNLISDIVDRFRLTFSVSKYIGGICPAFQWRWKAFLRVGHRSALQQQLNSHYKLGYVLPLQHWAIH